MVSMEVRASFSPYKMRVCTDMMWLVWLTFLIAEGLSAVIAVILMTGISRRRISTLGN